MSWYQTVVQTGDGTPIAIDTTNVKDIPSVSPVPKQEKDHIPIQQYDLCQVLLNLYPEPNLADDKGMLSTIVHYHQAVTCKPINIAGDCTAYESLGPSDYIRHLIVDMETAMGLGTGLRLGDLTRRFSRIRYYRTPPLRSFVEVEKEVSINGLDGIETQAMLVELQTFRDINPQSHRWLPYLRETALDIYINRVLGHLRVDLPTRKGFDPCDLLKIAWTYADKRNNEPTPFLHPRFDIVWRAFAFRYSAWRYHTFLSREGPMPVASDCQRLESVGELHADTLLSEAEQFLGLSVSDISDWRQKEKDCQDILRLNEFQQLFQRHPSPISTSYETCMTELQAHFVTDLDLAHGSLQECILFLVYAGTELGFLPPKRAGAHRVLLARLLHAELKSTLDDGQQGYDHDYDVISDSASPGSTQENENE